ncbi:outer membrane protein assembly factor BamE (lipoprotein component of BamABCDE complex) [Luteibacter sp. HA06]
MSNVVRAVALSMCLALGACATTTGRPFDAAQVHTFVDGQTTQTDVRQKLGEPQTTQRNPGGTTIWLYSSSNSPASFRDFVPFAGATSNSSMQALHLTFDQRGVMASHTLTTSAN